ncbi:MAG TPA: CPBP family intramembrane metalloprotease [Oscillatoriaceae cyanobacterium M33_DOE_052]|uniref:CPBP family intramembrane metalloprotease n=1 Tax=Planktothricoides sp. SpSt-374 TaxID=2282167 RepID=A0A7C3VNB9_9CYAN|nr:CPBP family intramembrane metalloprotease [Oscillatoriaceae cyanobacterium M33_DOE_052]
MNVNITSLGETSAPRRLAIFVILLLLLWAPAAIPAYIFISDQNLVSLLTMPVLYLEFIFLVKFWAQKVYGEPQILRNYGLEFTRQNARYLITGLGMGLLSLTTLLLFEGGLGWLGWQIPPAGFFKVMGEGFLVGLGVGFAEELLFRGWLLDELQRDYSPKVAMWADATIFAILHYIKPLEAMLEQLPAFPGLAILGVTLVWGKRYSGGRLGLPIGFHGGLVWGYYIVSNGHLISYSPDISDWLTGIHGNPIAGLTGIIWLSCIALFLRQKSLKN